MIEILCDDSTGCKEASNHDDYPRSRQRQTFNMSVNMFLWGSFLSFMFVMISCLFIAALWLPAGKGLTSWLPCVYCFIVFCHFLLWCPGSVVVLGCINF